MKLFILTSFFIYTSLFSSAAHALFGIPGTPSLPLFDPLDAARELERQQRCAKERDDANKNQRIAEAGQPEAQLALDQDLKNEYSI